VVTLTRSSELSVEIDPRDAGFDAERLARLDRFLDAYVASGRQKGNLIAICRHGKVAHLSFRGARNESAGLPVELDTIWRMYSMTKPITSTAAMLLYEEGALSLFDPVAKYIPAFADARVYRQGPAVNMISAPASEPLLVWHLMTHTSGLTYDWYYTHPVDEMYRKAGFGTPAAQEFTLEEACNRWASVPLLFEPGTAWNYSVSTDVLGRVVEVASGQSLDQFFASRIFEPLGMADTSFCVPPNDQQRLTRLYVIDPATDQLVLAPPNVESRGLNQPKMFSGGGGLVSTAADYLRFTNLLRGGGELDGVRLLSPQTVSLMSANHLPGGALITPPFGRSLIGPSFEGRGFGLGVAPLVDPVAAKTLSSAGEYCWGGAAGTAFWVDPAKDLTVVFCTQVYFARDDISYTLRQLVYQALVN
jgi:CubicO group peptidase (beta-lactamase class C family)